MSYGVGSLMIVFKPNSKQIYVCRKPLPARNVIIMSKESLACADIIKIKFEQFRAENPKQQLFVFVYYAYQKWYTVL